MKTLQLLIVLLLSSTSFFYASAQQSCSFIIHVDGVNGSDDVACGEEGTPCASINYGIDRATAEGFSNVRIAIGNGYNEVIELTDGISLWGGFNSQWAVVGQTSIAGGLGSNGEYYCINGDAINSATVLSDLEIQGPNAAIAGKSSYGIHITNSTGLVFQRLTIRGGAGSNGNAGIAGTNATVGGVNGLNGGNADEFNTTCNNSDSGAGGAGSVTPSNPNTAGGNGGRGGYMDSDCSFPFSYSATSGINGSNAISYVANSFGYRGTGGGTCSAGGNGQDGQTVHGTGGVGATVGSNLVGSYWASQAGANGTLGLNGTGGGGGGGSGGCDTGTDSYGAGGGGGGSGGIAAPTVGTGGLSGGNSVAAFLLSSSCSFINCNIINGSGGLGGAGGSSGLGTAGGNGGNGGASVGDSQAGGNGGNGGAGGNSGGGGGGAGGNAYGIYGTNSIIQRTGTTFTAGTGGLHGVGGVGFPGSVAGTDGLDGSSSDFGGTLTDNIESLVLEPEPCIEIVTIDLTVLSFCAGEATSVSFNAVGGFSGTNIFTAQLSDPTGDFSSPVDIGTLVSNTSGTVSVQLPIDAISGTGYRIRIISSATPAIGIENSTDITINALPDVVASASQTSVCAGAEVTLTGSGADLFTWDNNVSDGVSFIPTQTAYYTVVGVNSLTVCANIDSIEITVVDLPDTSVVASGNELAAVLGGASYQWLDCDNNFAIIEGAEAQTYLAPNSGNFAVAVTSNGCTDTSSCHNVFVVGLEDEITKGNVLLLYPNPSAGVFQLISDVEQPMEVTVFNTMGQMVYSLGSVTNHSSIDLQSLRNGLYSIRFFNHELNVVRQVIIQK